MTDTVQTYLTVGGVEYVEEEWTIPDGITVADLREHLADLPDEAMYDAMRWNDVSGAITWRRPLSDDDRAARQRAADAQRERQEQRDRAELARLQTLYGDTT